MSMRLYFLTLTVLLGAFALVFTDNVQAKPSNYELNNTSHKLLTCSVYYLIVAEGMSRGPSDKVRRSRRAVQNYKLWSRKMGMLSLIMLKAVSRKWKETYLYRQMIAAQTLNREMDDDFANMSILFAKYHEECNDYVRMMKNLEAK